MLIKIFGIWLMTSNITYLEPYKSNCFINFSMGGDYRETLRKEAYKPCGEVAAEINKKIKEMEGGK